MHAEKLRCCVIVGAATLLLANCGDSAPDRKAQAKTRKVVPLVVTQDSLAVCRFQPGMQPPPWASPRPGEFFSATHTPDEVSLIVTQSRAPSDAKCERGFRLLKVQGPLDFNQVGIIAGLSGTLADAGVSIFAFSTYDTDYVMVKQADLDRSLAALGRSGYALGQDR